MRPIDADAVLEKMRNTWDMQDLYLPVHFKEMIIDEMPTVDRELRNKLEDIVQSLGVQRPLLSRKELELYRTLKGVLDETN